jgi:hypothetical protein
MTAGRIGMVTSPPQGNRIPPGAVFMADNGRYSEKTDDRGRQLVGDDSPGWPGHAKYLTWLRRKVLPRAADCLFTVAPDQPFDMAATLGLAELWLPYLRRLGLPAALALQNGAENMTIRWADLDVACIGGSYEWKRSPAAAWLIREARAHGVRSHILRMNSGKAIRLAWGMDADSCDGGYLRFPDTNLPKLLGWLDDIEYRGAQMII